MSESPSRKKHTLMLDDRKRLVLTGAEDVSGFNEETIAVKTSAGNLMIKGSGLHIGNTAEATARARGSPSCSGRGRSWS